MARRAGILLCGVLVLQAAGCTHKTCVEKTTRPMLYHYCTEYDRNHACVGMASKVVEGVVCARWECKPGYVEVPHKKSAGGFKCRKPEAAAGGSGGRYGVRPAAVSSSSDAYDGFRPGDRVILGEHSPIGGMKFWAPPMMNYVGRSATIVALRGRDPSGSWVVHVDIDGGRWYWRTNVMRRAR